jgi:hypothetical protein
MASQTQNLKRAFAALDKANTAHKQAEAHLKTELRNYADANGMRGILQPERIRNQLGV